VVQLVGLGLLHGLPDVVVLDLADPHEGGQKRHGDGHGGVEAGGARVGTLGLAFASIERGFDDVAGFGHVQLQVGRGQDGRAECRLLNEVRAPSTESPSPFICQLDRDQDHPPCENAQLTRIKAASTMEAEHINQIGAQLSDLSARTEDLRRYL